MADKKEVIEVVESKEVLSSSWKEKLAKYAEDAKKFATSSGGGLPFFSLSGGTLKWHGEDIPHNTLIAIVLAQRFEYSYYTEQYNPGSVSPPVCFAIGDNPETLAPHDNSSDKQNDKCGIAGQAGCCPQNEWGSSTRREKAKACSNGIRIALLPAGKYIPKKNTTDAEVNPELFTDPYGFETQEIGYLRIPVTSTKNFKKLIKISASGGLPPFAYYTRIQVLKHDVNQFEVLFSPVKPILDGALLDVLELRLKESEEEIDTPYDKVEVKKEIDEKKESKKRKF